MTSCGSTRKPFWLQTPPLRAEGALEMISSERSAKRPIPLTVHLGLLPDLLGSFLLQPFVLSLALQEKYGIKYFSSLYLYINSHWPFYLELKFKLSFYLNLYKGEIHGFTDEIGIYWCGEKYTSSLIWIVRHLYLYAFSRLRTSDTSQIVEPYGNPERYSLRFFC